MDLRAMAMIEKLFSNRNKHGFQEKLFLNRKGYNSCFKAITREKRYFTKMAKIRADEQKQ